jgi:hypothetical protein
MQLTITGTKLLLFQEQRIIHQRQGVKDVELVLLCENKSVVDKSIEAFFQIILGE